LKAIATAEPVDQCTGLSRRPYGAQTEARSAVYLVEFRLVARPDVCHGLGVRSRGHGRAVASRGKHSVRYRVVGARASARRKGDM